MKTHYSILLLFILSACSTAKYHYCDTDKDWSQATLPESELLYSLYMIGDAGGDTSYSRPVLDGLQAKIAAENPDKSGVIFLGDNVYPNGLHKKSNELRAQDESRLNVQLEAIKDYKGDLMFIPGNHDWDRQGKKGWKNVNRQEHYIQDYLDRGNVFLPNHGCPGPIDVKLVPGLVVIIIDTQWWLHQYERPSGEKDGCEVRNSGELMVLFKDMLKKYRGQNVIVAAHHPLYSNGHHGGHFQTKDHIFPLTAKNKKAYVPLPVIGSIYPLHRKFVGHPQDISHPEYQDMKNQLLAAMNEYDNVIYAAGHEHNLQYTHKGSVHHVLSGAGSKLTYLKFDQNMNFGARERGYSKVNYYANGEVWLEFYTTDIITGEETRTYYKKLFQRDVITNKPVENVEKVSYEGKFATVTPDSTYGANNFKKLFFGDLNRDLWTKSLKVPYLDIHNVHGGLTPIKKGGGMQTLSLRMQGGDGKQYVLRGIRKNATFLTEKAIRGTVIQDVIYDGIAASHPYASVVVPELSRAADVYYTTPTLVYLPSDPILGDYRAEFGGMFCLFEERPDGDMSNSANVGNSKEVISYKEAIEEMHGSYKHVVDKDYVVRARLFDMMIGDWDRHDDQWRWASFKEGKKTLYRPIPRDRDQVFFKFDGAIMNIANRKWAVRKFQPFREEIRDISGQNFNARYFDRSFLIEPSKDEWMQIAADLKNNVTDEVIERAIKELPTEGYEVSGEEITRVLKARRDKLVETAEEYYAILAKEVSIPGTLKDDFFEVIRNDDGSVEVNVYPRKKGKKDENDRFYHRVFHKNETNEIRLYGLNGNDEYKLKGEVKKSILVRIVAGPEKDHVKDESKVNGLRKMTKIYEVEGHNDIQKSAETKVMESPEEEAYDYDRKDFVYDKFAPMLSIGSNVNDGFYIGPGFKYIKYGFKKEPYEQSHTLFANYAFGAEGFNFDYKYDFIDALGKADFAGEVKINRPLLYQFFGAGNEAEVIDEDIALNTVRMNNYEFNPRLKFASKNHSQILKVGLNLQHVGFEEVPSTVVADLLDNEQDFIGLGADYMYKNVDHTSFPTRGFVFKANGLWNNGIDDKSDVNYLKLGSEVRFYVPLLITKTLTTLNFRSGVEHNIGEYEFFQASFLHGFKNFRGIERNRYSGRTSFYNNLDLRKSLFKVGNRVAPFDVGLIGHTDLARVWVDNDDSDKYHVSYGGGVFFNILDSFNIMGTYSISEDSNLLLIGTNFFF